jgi:hypothetical protein
MLLSSVLLRPSLWLILCALVTSINGQGVYFSNTHPFVTPADRKVYASDGQPLVGTHFVAQLYYGTAASSLTPLTTSPAPFRNVSVTDPLAGTWVGAHRLLEGMMSGQVATLQVCAWDATGGLTIDEAKLLGRAWGESATFTYRIPGVGPDFLWYMEEFRAFTLVPEPSIIALVLVGFGGLWLPAAARLGRKRNNGLRRRTPTERRPYPLAEF